MRLRRSQLDAHAQAKMRRACAGQNEMRMHRPTGDAHANLNEVKCHSNALSLKVRVDGIYSAMKRSVSVLIINLLRSLLFSCTFLRPTRLYNCF